MKASVKWINEYLVPGDVSAEDATRVLTFAGMPIDSSEPAPGGDTVLEVELTSNRGDCLCHVGLAREIAAATGRKLKPVGAGKHTPPKAASLDGYTLSNEIKDKGCPRFMLRLIKGVKVGPSPAWLKERLEAIGQRSINNVVDVTNFVLHEMGQPAHVFDAGRVAGKKLTVRAAVKGEKLALLDGRTITLGGGEMVICDASGPASLAGVMGGLPTSVTEQTRDVLLEIATWEPVLVRMASRRHNTRSDSSHRYERVVDARTLDGAAGRLVELIEQVSGGKAVDGVLDEGGPLAAAETATLRAARVKEVLGIDVAPGEITKVLMAHGFEVNPRPAAGGDARPTRYDWLVTIPAHRPDVRLEIDLIEEVARTIGYDRLVVSEKLAVRVETPQAGERARRELSRVLTGLGFFETVTFSFTNAKQAKMFTPPEVKTVSVTDDRRADDGVLRPSVLTGLLTCRAANQHARVEAEGGVRLFESASVFGEIGGKSGENRNLALLADLPTGGNAFERRQAGVRLMRGVIEEVVGALVGPGAKLEFAAAGGDARPTHVMPFTALDAAASALVTLNGQRLGVMGVAAAACQALYDLQGPVVMAEISVDPLLGAYPPKATVRELPHLPPVERDLSADVDERITWGQVAGVVEAWKPSLLESYRFVTTYRGKPLSAGKKSVTFRMVFRDAAKTLRDEDVTPHVAALMKSLGEKVGAGFRKA